MDVNADTIDIEEIYRIIGEDNNNDLAIDWYDVVDVSTEIFNACNNSFIPTTSRPLSGGRIDNVNMTYANSIWEYCVNSSCVPTTDDQVDRVVNMRQIFYICIDDWVDRVVNIQQIFNICNNNKKRFVPGDEPFKFIDS